MASNMETSPKSVTGFYEWVVPNFAGSTKRLESPTFKVGRFCWRLLFFPTGIGATIKDHVSVFLLYPEAHTCPPGSQQCPDIDFSVKITNFKDRKLDHAKSAKHKFNSEQVDWGFTYFLHRDQLTTERGFLTPDGSLVLLLELEVKNPSCLHSDPGRTRLAADLLALLDHDPCSTSDLTVIVGGGNVSAAGGHASNNSGGGSGGGNGGCLPRSFRVHRAVLASRCPFFRTLFNAGMADSAARELTLPDADPDAFAVLLRYMYGGVVSLCERAVHRAAVSLCNTLLLPEVKEALEKVLVETANAETITGDLLWAAGHGQEEVLEELVAVYKRVVTDVDPVEVVAMAAACPDLVPRLLTGATQPEQQQPEQ